MSENLILISGSKEEQYSSLLPQIKSLVEGETDLIANLANVTAALKEACTRIRKGRGVCGTAWQEKQTLIVPDVDAFPGHIACSSLSRSEIVVPLLKDGEVWGVLDIDSEQLSTFDETDRKYLEELCTYL